MEKSVRIRKAKKADFPFLGSVFRNAVKKLGKTHYTPQQIRIWAKAGRFSYAKSKKRKEIFFVAVCGSKIVGFSSILEKEVHELYLHSAFSGQSVGQKLLAAAETELSKKGFRQIHLIASMNAYPFYRSQGWKKTRPVIRVLQGVSFNSVAMTKKIKTSNRSVER